MSGENHVVLQREDSFLVEIWVWYVLGFLVIFTRMSVRLRTVGWRSLAGDDYLALLSLLFYTADAVLVHICYIDGTNVDVQPEALDYLTDKEISDFTRGSKAQLAAWYTYTALIWCMKFMVLFFYKRLMMGTFQVKYVKSFFWLCGVTYIAVFLTITFGCHPFHQNWQVRPLAPRQCAFKPQNFYVGAVLNVFTDALLLSIPIPMLWALQVRLSKKIAIGVLLSSGLFVIGAAVTRAVLTLGSAPSGLNINRWGVRETIVGILTVNMPILPPMFKRAFWSTSSYHESYSAEESRSKGRYGNGTYELRSRATLSRHEKEDPEIDVASQGSQENIIRNDANNGATHGSRNVMVETSIQVQSHHRDTESRMEWTNNQDGLGCNSVVTTTKKTF